MQKDEDLEQTDLSRTDNWTQIVTSWAPVGAKNKNESSNC